MIRAIAVGLIALFMGAFATLAQGSDLKLPSIPERNKICFGDQVGVIIRDKTHQRSVKLTIPTRFFGASPTYQADLEAQDDREATAQGKSKPSTPERWPHCAKTPLDLGFRNWNALIDSAIGNDGVDRRGTALEPFPPNSVYRVSIGISPMKYDFRDGNHMADKEMLRRWFGEQQTAGNLNTLAEGLRSIAFDSERMNNSSSYNWLFESSGATSEPTTGLPVMYDCTGGMSETFIICGTTYEMKGGITLSYQFLYNGLPKTNWTDLDIAMRKFAISLVQDEGIRALNGYRRQ